MKAIRDDVSIRLIIIASIYYAQIAAAEGDAGALEWIRSTGAHWLESIGMDADRSISRWIQQGCPRPPNMDIVKQAGIERRRVGRDLDRARRSQAAPATA